MEREFAGSKKSSIREPVHGVEKFRDINAFCKVRCQISAELFEMCTGNEPLVERWG